MYSPITPKEKATAATVAIHCAFQRFKHYQDSSTNILVVQGQTIENHHNSINLIASMGTTGAKNTKGGQRH